MIVEVEVPAQGLTITEATLLRIFKRVGDMVVAGDPLFEIETDKAVQEIESPVAGVIESVLGKAGDVVPLGSILVHIATDQAASTDPAVRAPAIATEPVPALKLAPLPQQMAASKPKHSNSVPISPRALRLLTRFDIALGQMEAGSCGQHIHEKDVLAFVAKTQRQSNVKVDRYIRLSREVRAGELMEACEQLSIISRELSKSEVKPIDFVVKAAALSMEIAKWNEASAISVRHRGTSYRLPSLSMMPFSMASTIRCNAVGGDGQAESVPGDMLVVDLTNSGIDSAEMNICDPYCGILSVGAIKSRPVIIGHDLVAAETIFVTLVTKDSMEGIDGAVSFMDQLCRMLEKPVLVFA